MKRLSALVVTLLLPLGALGQASPVAPPAAPSSVVPSMPPPIASGDAATAAAQPPALVMQSPENLRPGPALSALDPVATSGAIASWMFDSRDTEASAVEMRIDATARAVEALKISAGDYRYEAPFRAATMGVSTAEDQLRRSIKTARLSTPEKWADARGKVSTDFKAYADAVTQAETLVAGNAQPPISGVTVK